MKVTVDLTEEVVYSAIDEVGKELLSFLQYNDKTGNLRSSPSYFITRNGRTVTEEDIKKMRGQKHERADYQLIVSIGL